MNLVCCFLFRCSVTWPNSQLHYTLTVWNAVCIHFNMWHIKGQLLKISNNVTSAVKPGFVWSGASVAKSLWNKRLMHGGGQRRLRVTSVLGLPRVHMPQSCETKNRRPITNFTEVLWRACFELQGKSSDLKNEDQFSANKFMKTCLLSSKVTENNPDILISRPWDLWYLNVKPFIIKSENMFLIIKYNLWFKTVKNLTGGCCMFRHWKKSIIRKMLWRYQK